MFCGESVLDRCMPCCCCGFRIYLFIIIIIIIIIIIFYTHRFMFLLMKKGVYITKVKILKGADTLSHFLNCVN